MSFEIQYSPLAEEDLDRVWDEVFEHQATSISLINT